MKRLAVEGGETDATMIRWKIEIGVGGSVGIGYSVESRLFKKGDAICVFQELHHTNPNLTVGLSVRRKLPLKKRKGQWAPKALANGQYFLAYLRQDGSDSYGLSDVFTVTDGLAKEEETCGAKKAARREARMKAGRIKKANMRQEKAGVEAAAAGEKQSLKQEKVPGGGAAERKLMELELAYEAASDSDDEQRYEKKMKKLRKKMPFPPDLPPAQQAGPWHARAVSGDMQARALSMFTMSEEKFNVIKRESNFRFHPAWNGAYRCAIRQKLKKMGVQQSEQSGLMHRSKWKGYLDYEVKESVMTSKHGETARIWQRLVREKNHLLDLYKAKFGRKY